MANSKKQPVMLVLGKTLFFVATFFCSSYCHESIRTAGFAIVGSNVCGTECRGLRPAGRHAAQKAHACQRGSQEKRDRKLLLLGVGFDFRQFCTVFPLRTITAGYEIEPDGDKNYRQDEIIEIELLTDDDHANESKDK